jgi:predicted metal-dependent enzyme (double-stranded beta helix superfamily)
MRHTAVALPAVPLLALFGCAAQGPSPQPPLSKSTARYVAHLEGPARGAWPKPDEGFLVLRPAPRYSFEPLAEGISAVMSSEAEARDKQFQVAALLSDYLQQSRLEAKFQRPNPRLPVTTYLLHTDPAGRFSIAALVFQPRARTTIHDHQSWVVWGTYSGKERETRYRRRDVSGQSFPQLTPAWVRVFASSEVSFIDPPPGDIHDVENANDSVSVSLHVHATDIGKQARNSYDVRNKIVKSFVQSYEPAM